jgi:hypothetical protein
MKVFVLIVLAGLGCGFLGSGFGWLVGSLSPEFITLVAHPYSVAEPRRLAAALGLVSGLLLGATAMAFGQLVDAFQSWAIRGKTGRDSSLNQTSHQSGHADEDSLSRSVRPA